MNLLQHMIVSLIIGLPALGVLVILAVPSRKGGAVRGVALAIACAEIILAVLLLQGVTGSGEFEIMQAHAWIPQLGIAYRVGVDGSSACLILLSTCVLALAIIASWKERLVRVRLYHALLLTMASGISGSFAALDGMLFFGFWELTLISFALFLAIWGGNDRFFASLKFLLFAMTGSMMLLAVFLFLASKSASFNLLDWYAVRLTPLEQRWLFFGTLLAFGVMVPLPLLHTWLANAQEEAPTAGNIMLAGSLLNMGAYGLLRFGLPLFPLAVQLVAPMLAFIIVLGILIAALIALVQTDLKRFLAFCSICLMGFVMLGFFALEEHAAAGSVWLMLSQGLVMAALFWLVGLLERRGNTLNLNAYRGFAKGMPLMMGCWLLVGGAAMGIPGGNLFPGLLLILLGSFQTHTAVAGLALVRVLVLALALLLMLFHLCFGRMQGDGEMRPEDVRRAEWVPCLIVIMLIMVMGIWPQPILSKITRPAKAMVLLSTRVEMIIPVRELPDPGRKTSQER